jgi:hypothetical protein
VLVIGSNVAPAHRRASAPKCAFVATVERLRASKAVFIGRANEIQESEGIQVGKFGVAKFWKFVRAKEVTVVNYVHGGAIVEPLQIRTPRQTL